MIYMSVLLQEAECHRFTATSNIHKATSKRPRATNNRPTATNNRRMGTNNQRTATNNQRHSDNNPRLMAAGFPSLCVRFLRNSDLLLPNVAITPFFL